MMKSLFFALVCLLSPLAACGQFTIEVSPSSVSLTSGTQQQFLVSEANAQNPSGVWSASGGSIDSNGLFTAPNVTADSTVVVSFTDSQNNLSSSSLVSVISLVDGPATLPVTVPNSSMASTPAPGQVIQVAPGGLQTAINSANCGDTLQLPAGTSFSGAYTLPKKACDDAHWVIIRSAANDSVLPPEGTEINPCYAGVLSLPGRPSFSCPSAAFLGAMAKIVASKNSSTLTLQDGANHYRIGPGLEITRAIGDGVHYNLIQPAASADHIVIDRDWIHGTAQDDTQRAVLLSGVTYAGIVDSYLSDFHCTAAIGQCVDAQAIAGGTGQLPQGTWKIEDNFLEGAAETILFGGVVKNSVTPADITIRRNHLFKPLTWMFGYPGFVGGKDTAISGCPKYDPNGGGQCPFVVKNIFELKNAQRLLFEGNVLENVWPGFSQYGGSILLSGLNPSPLPGEAVNSMISIAEVTIRYNRIAHSTGGPSIANMAGGGDGNAPAQPNLPVYNVSVHDNVFDDMSSTYDQGKTPLSDFLMFQISSCPVCAPLTGISIRHNTVLSASPKTAFILGSPAPQQLDFSFMDNLVTFPAGLAIIANATTCANTGNTNLSRINACLKPGSPFTNNALIGATNTWPAGNFLLSSSSLVGFTNYGTGNGGDYTLLPTSKYKNAGTDGKDLGADVGAVNAHIAGVN